MTPGKQTALRWLLYLAAGAVILMALAVGVLRLLLPLVPQYQDDIRVWASNATGYDIRFRSISASWPLSGPELSFYDVRLSHPGERAEVLAARELSVGLSLFRLVRDGRATVGHVAVSGTRVGVERTPEGGFLFQGRTLTELLPKLPRDPHPEVDVELRDIAIEYLDQRREPKPLALKLESLDASLDGESLSGDATLTLPRGYGRTLDLELSTPLPLPSPLALPASFDARASGTGLDIERILRFALGDAGPLRAATGDVAVELGYRENRPQHLQANLDVDDVVVGSGPGSTTYQRMAARVDWDRSARGWGAAMKKVRLRRDGRDSPTSAAELHYEAAGAATPERWTGRADFLRLEDLFPLARAALAGTEMEASLPRLLRGDIRGVEAEFATPAGEPARYSLRLGFDRLGLATAAGDVAVEGLSGSVAADGDGGRLQIDSRGVAVTLSQWFREVLRAETLKGLLIWRTGSEGVRFLSDDIALRTAAIDIRSRLELQFPADASSPVIDLKANASATAAREVLRYLPLRRFPPKVVDWLERAVVAGKVPKATVDFSGPLREFPFDHGEGVFRVGLELEDGTLDYANGWPRIENLVAEVVFDGVGMYSTTNSARLANLDVKNYSVSIPDLRRGILAVAGGQRTGVADILDFVRATPLATSIGPVLDRANGSGPVDAAVRLALPIAEIAKYDLKVLFDARGCRVGLERVPLDLKDLRGRIRLENTHFTAAGLRAVMLGEPVTIDLRPEADAAAPFSHVAEFAGATPVPRLTSTFSLPLREYLDGRAEWRAIAAIPARRPGPPVPLTVTVQSDLRGVTSTLPQPLGKPADAAWPATFKLEFPEADVIDISGRMEPPFAWVAELKSVKGSWHVDRGALRAGPGDVRLPQKRDVEISGHVADLHLAEWLELGGGGGGGRSFRETYRDIALRIDRLIVAGQVFRDVDATARRGPDSWLVSVQGPRAEGEIVLPFDTAAKPLKLDMKRLWLLESEAGGGRTDPRDVMGVELTADDAALGERRLGRLEMSVARTPDGLVARRIAAKAESFQIDGTGSWLVEGGDVDSQFTRLDLALKATDIKATLAQLGFEPAIAGKEANVTASLVWPDGPSSDFLEKSSGRISVQMKKGQVMDLEPGGSGRLLGLMSVTALPRRLALDFRDVFNEGLAFDEIKGDFRVGSGSGYTCNLGLTGPAADIGIVGRTGFGARVYDQVAVVRPQVSNVLTVGGVVLGGPVGGVTMALISQIFRKPLSTLGESYYRVSGGWDRPEVVRVQRSEVDASAFKDCEKEVTAALEETAIQPPADAPPTPAPPPVEPR